MITIPPPKDEPEYTIAERSRLRTMFKKAREILIQGRRAYICHALTLTLTRDDDTGWDDSEVPSKAHELILRRLGTDPNDSLLRPHTYCGWLSSVNPENIREFGTHTLRIHWLDSLIKEFE